MVKNMHLHVTCAIIEKGGTVLVAQRSSDMSMPLKWEFPGGKIHEGETPEECLRREIIEELNLELIIKDSLDLCTYRYPAFTITLYPFVCERKDGMPLVREHEEIRWVSPTELPDIAWAEADVAVMESYLNYIGISQ